MQIKKKVIFDQVGRNQVIYMNDVWHRHNKSSRDARVTRLWVAKEDLLSFDTPEIGLFQMADAGVKKSDNEFFPNFPSSKIEDDAVTDGH